MMQQTTSFVFPVLILARRLADSIVDRVFYALFSGSDDAFCAVKCRMKMIKAFRPILLFCFFEILAYKPESLQACPPCSQI